MFQLAVGGLFQFTILAQGDDFPVGVFLVGRHFVYFYSVVGLFGELSCVIGVTVVVDAMVAVSGHSIVGVIVVAPYVVVVFLQEKLFGGGCLVASLKVYPCIE